MKDIIEVIRLRIKILMDEKGWDEKMLAEKAGLSLYVIHDILTDSNDIDFNIILKISKAFGLYLSDFYCEELFDKHDFKS